ncbi:hypothetical protein Cfla_3704 [Cellulomonas flavigena DSM 20109]|uniref:Uncharacterized protein n=1 Tax=Cellulomonas flavigena (strain ATCC 482 / DSM 20109 / BCRC 11376 / JCM 18109 / NBRC 3775 / NCIMB 8073 / NRS 134) TaxID=446466 RepID=D5UE96_CELFN|nr:hypothetical protein [Cellulomonas flavigena]ADG76572.1 hypothetical protein Cfla_3704 [Cellulomonas flavigena DSM 20109]
MTDVHDLLARTHRALGEAGTTLDDARHDALLTGIRRRRRRRHAAEVLGVSALVLVLGAGGWLGLARDGTPQPAESTSPTPEPSAGPTSDAAPDAPGLEPALVMPPGTLETATPGWVLTVQRPVALSESGDGMPEASANVVDAVAPDGTRYRVLDLPLGPTVDLVGWEAGTTEATVSVDEDGERTAARLDLLTGEITALTELAGMEVRVGTTSAGLDVWVGELEAGLAVYDGTTVVRELPFVRGPVLDPAGTRVAGTVDGSLATVDVTSGQVTDLVTPSEDCHVLAWEASGLLVTCLGWEESAPAVSEVLRFDADDPRAAGVPLDLPASTLPYSSGGRIGDGRLVVQHTFDVECTRGWGLLDPMAGTLQDLPFPAEGIPAGEASVRVQQVAGDVVLLTVGDACSGGGGPLRVLTYDVATGTTTQIASPPSSDGLAAGEQWISATTSTILAG